MCFPGRSERQGLRCFPGSCGRSSSWRRSSSAEPSRSVPRAGRTRRTGRCACWPNVPAGGGSCPRGTVDRGPGTRATSPGCCGPITAPPSPARSASTRSPSPGSGNPPGDGTCGLGDPANLPRGRGRPHRQGLQGGTRRGLIHTVVGAVAAQVRRVRSSCGPERASAPAQVSMRQTAEMRSAGRGSPRRSWRRWVRGMPLGVCLVPLCGAGGEWRSRDRGG